MSYAGAVRPSLLGESSLGCGAGPDIRADSAKNRVFADDMSRSRLLEICARQIDRQPI
jgi:hypothetical protein